MSAYVLTALAEADLEDIWNYTVSQWSLTQAERYIEQIRTAIEAVAADPSRGQAYDMVRSGYRKYGAGSHIIFFRKTGAAVEIVRILHQRMDFERHL